MGARPSRDEVTSALLRLIATMGFSVIYIKRRERESSINEGVSLRRARLNQPGGAAAPQSWAGPAPVLDQQHPRCQPVPA